MLASGFGSSVLWPRKDRALLVSLLADVIAVLICPLFALRRVLLLQLAAVDGLLLPLQRWQQNPTETIDKAAALKCLRPASAGVSLSHIRQKYQQAAEPQLCKSVQVKILPGRRQFSDQVSRCDSSSPPQTSSHFTDPGLGTSSASSYDSVWTTSSQGQWYLRERVNALEMANSALVSRLNAIKQEQSNSQDSADTMVDCLADFEPPGQHSQVFADMVRTPSALTPICCNRSCASPSTSKQLHQGLAGILRKLKS